MSIKRAILKATDAKLRSDNWQYILDVCDLVTDDPEDGGKEAINIIEERLEQKDANVILRTLSLTTSLAENCGSRLKQFIDSKRFTGILYSLIESRVVHNTVKKEIAGVVKQLTQSFQSDPSLRYMKDLYKQIKVSHQSLFNSDQPNVPSKKQMNSDSKEKEDKDLEEALRVSLLEFEQQKSNQSASRQDEGQEKRQEKEVTHPSVVKKVRAMYDLSTTEQDELSFKKGDIIVVLEQVYRDWWRGTLRGRIGIFPLNYVTPIEEPSVQELREEKKREDQLLEQKRNVEELYRVLQDYQRGNDANDPTQNPGVNALYGSVTPLRPEVAKMIGKYARKREDLVSLRQVLANAELTYNQLLDRATDTYTSSISSEQSRRYNQQGQLQAQGQYYGYYGPPDPSRNYANQLQQQMSSPQQRQQTSHTTRHPQHPISHQAYAQQALQGQKQIFPPVSSTTPYPSTEKPSDPPSI